jgi:SpoVK/Ycf46/Vps4 family AAA+-type ATPase
MEPSMEIAPDMTATAHAGDRSEPRRTYVRHANLWSLPRAGAGELDARTVFMARLTGVYQRVIAARAAVENVPVETVPGHASTSVESAHLIDDAMHAELPMARLAAKLALTPAQVDLVWTVAASSVDARLVPHLEALGGAHARRGLSLAVYALLDGVDGDSVAELAHWLASANPLVETGLVDATEQMSPAARAYVASPRLVSFLSGDDDLAAPLRRVREPAMVLHDANQTASIDDIRPVLRGAGNIALVIEGPPGSGRLTAAACALGGELVALDLARLAPTQLEDGLRALRREQLLRSQVPALANVDRVLGEDAHECRQLVGALIDRIDGPLIITAVTTGLDLGTERPLVRIRWSPPSTEVRAALWMRAVQTAGAAPDTDLWELAHRYRVGPAAIARAVTSARLAHTPGRALDETALSAGLRHNIAEQLGGLAQRIEVTQSWEDLVIADDIADMIAALVGRVRHAHQVLDRWGYRKKIARGAGVAALFSGPPGTGKTMVAGLVARELDLELYQVDLSKVVSKWVGETEKNLSRIFDAAEQGHALLLFDEADALFGQRSVETHGANDRYANLEVNYLLQRVEAFGGITILTTNLESAIDDALKRRLAAHIVFAVPDEDERARLWERQTVTGTAPIAGDVDHGELARAFPSMTGAHIRNAALSAAFLAAAASAPRITHEHLIRAARAEYRSMGHMVSEAMASWSQPRRK